ncbi:MAG: hypothetical protein MMC33_002091 [Icmadophila ericetorum]|nr:hypothetical protein [Icmadophila ericetorum]
MEAIDFEEQHHRTSLAFSSDIQTSSPLSIRNDIARESIEHDFEEDEDHEDSLSGSGRNSSGPDEAVFDDAIGITRQSSPHTSHHSEDEISELPMESRAGSLAPTQRHSSFQSSRKTRSPFRNPSSVRAIQLETTPPPFSISSTSQYYKINLPSRNSTPRSLRAVHSRSPSKNSPTKKMKKEYPLVLLHVTVLPVTLPYPPRAMEAILPDYILENWKLLHERITEMVLERGILIPHPREDYELLEERLLESLELKTPRILQCGHYHQDSDTDSHESVQLNEYDSDNDEDICGDCGRRVRDGQHGSGTGKRRWDIKIYAANGLMRAGAWSAAWNEMERIDVEILPWIEEDLRKELDLRRREEEEEAARRRVPPLDDVTPPLPPNEGRASRTDEARIREIYGNDAQAYVDGLEEEWRRTEAQSRPQRAAAANAPRPQELPLGILIRNYVHRAAQDGRNIVIFVLSLMVLVLAIGSQPLQPAALQEQTPQVQFAHTPTVTIKSALFPESSLAVVGAALSISPVLSEADAKLVPSVPNGDETITVTVTGENVVKEAKATVESLRGPKELKT